MVLEPQRSRGMRRVCKLALVVAGAKADRIARQLPELLRRERSHEPGVDSTGEKDTQGHVRKQLPLDRLR